jgi:hypothetical protein
VALHELPRTVTQVGLGFVHPRATIICGAVEFSGEPSLREALVEEVVRLTLQVES